MFPNKIGTNWAAKKPTESFGDVVTMGIAVKFIPLDVTKIVFILLHIPLIYQFTLRFKFNFLNKFIFLRLVLTCH